MAGAPKLSSLQAQLRRSSSGLAPTSAPAPKPSSALSPQGHKRPAEDALGGQAKKAAGPVITKQPPQMSKAPITKSAPTTVGAAVPVKSPGPGPFAKLPPPTPPMPATAPGALVAAAQDASSKKANEIEDIKALQAKLAALKAKANSLQADIKAKATGAAVKAVAPEKPAQTTPGAAVKAPAPVVKSPAAVITKAPAPASANVVAMAQQTKAPSAASMAQQTKAPAAAAQQTKAPAAAPAASAAAAAASAKMLPVKRPPGAPPAGVANGQQPPTAAAQETVNVDSATAEALKTFTAGLSKHQGKSKLVLLARLVEALHHDLTIDQTIYFQRLCRKKVIDRAAQDGIQASQLATTAAAAAKTAPAVGPGGAVAAQASAGASAAPAAEPAIRPPAAATAPPRPPQARPGVPVRPVSAPTASPPVRQPSTASVGSTNGPAQSPPSSPPASDLSGESPLYALVSELTEDPICVEGLLNEARLNQVLKRLWDGVAQKPKDWCAAWQALTIPLDRQAEVLQKFLNMAFVQTEGHSPEQAPSIIAELTKGHKIKMTVVEEVLVAFGHNLDGVLAMNEEAWHVYAYFLLHVYPKPAKSGWGWSRVGWSWLNWWKFVEKCIMSLDSVKALDVLSMLLRLVQEREGVPLSEVWNDGAKIKTVITTLGERGASSEAEVISRLSIDGVSIEAAP